MRRLAVIGLLAAGPCAVHAAPPAPDDHAPTVDELIERIEGLEDDKVRMQGEIDELRTRVGEDWLTETRADEIRSLVADVLADADRRASLQSDGLTAGWSDHFFLASPDGRFKLQLAGQLQFRWLWNFHDAPDRYIYGFENARTKLIFSGHVFNPGLTYRVEGEFNRQGGFGLLEDAWIRYQLDPDWALRIGQFKLPFNREELVHSANQQVIERSLVNQSHNIGRSQGVELFYEKKSWRWAFAVSDAGTDNIAGGGFVGSMPQNSIWSQAGLAELALTTRFEHLLAGRWEQFDDMTSPPGQEFAAMVGFAGHYQLQEYGTGFLGIRNEERWAAGALDLSLEFGGANVFAAATYHWIDDPQSGIVNTLGLVLQGGAFFSTKFEAYARLEYGFFDFPVFSVPELWVLTLGGNYYFDGNDVKLSADIGFGISEIGNAWDNDQAGYRLDTGGSDPQVVIRVQFQLLF